MSSDTINLNDKPIKQCKICFDEKNPNECIVCENDYDHLVCKDCFSIQVCSQTDPECFRDFINCDCNIFCSLCKNQYDIRKIIPFMDDVALNKFMKARDEAIKIEIEDKCQKTIEIQQKKLDALEHLHGDKKSNAQIHRKAICDNILDFDERKEVIAQITGDLADLNIDIDQHGSQIVKKIDRNPHEVQRAQGIQVVQERGRAIVRGEYRHKKKALSATKRTPSGGRVQKKALSATKRTPSGGRVQKKALSATKRTPSERRERSSNDDCVIQ